MGMIKEEVSLQQGVPGSPKFMRPARPGGGSRVEEIYRAIFSSGEHIPRNRRVARSTRFLAGTARPVYPEFHYADPAL